MRGFKIVSVLTTVALGVSAQLDCSDAPEWTAKIYAGGSMADLATVSHSGNKYKQQWWAAETDVPGVDGGPWALVGPCIPGTSGGSGNGDSGNGDSGNGNESGNGNGNGNGTGNGGSTVNCMDTEWWDGAVTYESEGTNVVFDGKQWRSKWWSLSAPPTVAEDAPWDFIANCAENTIPPRPVKPSNPQVDAMLCSCCQDCVAAGTTGPECKELHNGECFFTDCRQINSFNEGVCKDVVEGSKHMYYTGEIKEGVKVWPSKVYAPYVDSGLYPPPRLAQIAQATGVKHFNLAFVQSAQTTNSLNGCHGSIAGMAIEQGPIAWDEVNAKNIYMWDDVNALRELGGDIIVSFGGAAGIELADRAECYEGDIINNLVDAYSAVIDYLKLTHIDFDIEGAAAAKNNQATGWKNRFIAVKQLKEKYPYLKVWWTLPVLPAGLVDDGVLFMTDLVAADAPMDILNVMNMDYGDNVVCKGDLMGPCEREAMGNVAQQLFDIVQKQGKLSQYGWSSVQDVYPRLGSTPMLGMNDVTTEMYHISDARESLNEWKTSKPLGLVSNWSLARDDVCEASIGYVSLTCSGAPDQTEQFQFAKIFNQYTSA